MPFAARISEIIEKPQRHLGRRIGGVRTWKLAISRWSATHFYIGSGRHNAEGARRHQIRETEAARGSVVPGSPLCLRPLAALGTCHNNCWLPVSIARRV